MPKKPSQGQLAGQSIGSVAGAGLGTALGGPIGAPIGSTVGGAAGALIGQNTNTGQGTIGTAIGSTFGPFGALVGGEIGGMFHESQAHKETKARDDYIGRLQESGLLDSDGMLTLPDGSTHNFTHNGNPRPWKNPGRRGNGPDRDLYDYEIDYTNDLDYVAGMTGISLSRILSGGANKAVDQVGNRLGNSILGQVGYGQDLTQENFNHIMNNARSVYGRQGIKSKEDMLALANKMYGDGRITDFDRGVMNQTASLVFDNDFGTAQQLMGGRDKGLEVAHSTPSNTGRLPQSKPGRIYSPVISPEEAFLSVQPFFDEYNRKFPGRKPSKSTENIATISQAAGAVSAVAGAFKTLDQKTGGALSDYVKGGLQSLGEALGIVGPDLGIAELPEADVLSSGFDLAEVADVGASLFG